MKDDDDNSITRVVALVHEYLDVLRAGEDAPTSPVHSFVPAKQRRELRRGAIRLRQGRSEPRYKNLFTAEQLAYLYEQTARRDELFEQYVRDLKRIARELGRIQKVDPAVVHEAMKTVLLETQQAAEEQGPDSEAARRFRNVMRLAAVGRRGLKQKRRQKSQAPPQYDMAPEPPFEEWFRSMAAEHLLSPPPGVPVIAIPPEGQDSGRDRIYLRIGGTSKTSWVGSFECGHASVTTIFMLPDRKHLFISAQGAGYVIDAQSRTLVETTGTTIVGTMRDPALTLFVVDHGGMSLEAFGKSGRLWRTGIISSGGFRRMDITEDAIVGEARLITARRGWVGFSVKVGTGEVELFA